MRLPDWKWQVCGMLLLATLLNYMDRQMLATMRPAMQVDIKELQSASNFGSLMAIFLWIYGFMSPVSGFIADRMNRKWLITISLLIWSAVTYGMGYATSYHAIYWLRAIMGVSEALYIPAGLSLIADYHGPRSRSLAIGIHMTGLYAGQALGGFGAVMAHSYSWQTAFHTLGLTGIVYAFWLVALLKEKRRPASDHQANTQLLPLFGSFPFWILLICFAVASLPGWAARNWLPTLVAETFHLDMSTAGPISTITIAASSLIGVLFGGLVSDKWVRTNLKGRVYTSSIGLLLTIPALLLIGTGQTALSVVTAGFCFGFGYGMFDANNMPILCQFISPTYRATAYGCMNMVGVFAGALVTQVLGRSSDTGHLGQGFAVLAFIVAGALILQLCFLKPLYNDKQI